MQSQFTGLEAKVIEDIVNAIFVAEAPAVSNGNDRSPSSPTTA
jgi:hypothetical protein